MTDEFLLTKVRFIVMERMRKSRLYITDPVKQRGSKEASRFWQDVIENPI